MSALFILLFISLPTFFLIRILLKRIKPEWSAYRSPALWLSTLFLTPVIYVGLFTLYFLVATYYPEREFDKSSWDQFEERRYEYADDLVDNEKLIGLTKEEVQLMLGEPSYENESSLSYYLGFSPGHFISIDPDWLEIKFEEGKVNEVSIEHG